MNKLIQIIDTILTLPIEIFKESSDLTKGFIVLVIIIVGLLLAFNSTGIPSW